MRSSLLGHDLADNTSLDLAPVEVLDPGHDAPCMQWPENPGPANAAASTKPDGVPVYHYNRQTGEYIKTSYLPDARTSYIKAFNEMPGETVASLAPPQGEAWSDSDIVNPVAVDGEPATTSRSKSQRHGIERLLKSKAARKFFDACLLRGMDSLLSECPNKLPLVAESDYMHDGNVKEIQDAAADVGQVLDRIAAAALILTMRRQDILGNDGPCDYSELLENGITWAYGCATNEAAL